MNYECRLRFGSRILPMNLLAQSAHQKKGKQIANFAKLNFLNVGFETTSKLK
jgi:hypothetical protein